MSEVARLLSDSMERLLAGEAVSEGEPSARVLAALEDAGLAMALVPEAAGGHACSWADASVLPRLVGARAVACPIVEILLASKVAAALKLQTVAGEIGIACAPGLSVRRSGSGAATVDGAALDAAVWPTVRQLLFPVRDADGIARIVRVAPLSLAAATERNLFGQLRLRLPPEGAELAAATLHDAPEGTDPETLAAQGASLAAAAMVGAMEQALALMIDYANTRVQFGRPVGRFQAIQALVARSAAETAAASAALSNALHALDQGRADGLEPPIAKAKAGTAATFVAAAAHQVFGAIGFTDEHVLHHLTKRLWAWREEWGRQGACEAKIGRRVLGAGGDALWPMLVDER